jgi:chromatin assembly factor 1 subunit B
MIFAVGTFDQVIIYSTQQIQPIAAISNLHYANINDLSWNY